MRRRLVLVTAAATALVAAAPAWAAPPAVPTTLAFDGDKPPPPERPRFALTVVESIALMLPATIYYWSTTDLQKEDWELDWDWDSWRTKLTSFDALIVDTGTWESNAMRHPLVGALSYQVPRANGYGPGASTLFDFLSALAWEYLAEFKEKVSLNDLVVNTASGYLIGEPMFQLGELADAPGASHPRRIVGALTSPFRRLHTELGYAGPVRSRPAWARLELGLGAGAARFGATTYGETRIGLDADVVTHRQYRRPGAGSDWAPAAAWSRILIDFRVGEDGITAARALSMATYGGRYTRDLDDDGHGRDRFLGLAAGFDYDSRRLADEWDRTAVFHLLGPRFALGYHGEDVDLSWEIAAYGDLAMVQAHAFGPVPPFSFELTSVLRARGYYYATGTSAMTRLGVVSRRWSADLEARAYQMWSIDGLDRIEMNGGPDSLEDPEMVTDERVFGRARAGYFLGSSGANRLELAVTGAFRRGDWSAIDRRTTELGVDAGLVLGF